MYFPLVTYSVHVPNVFSIIPFLLTLKIYLLFPVHSEKVRLSCKASPLGLLSN